MKADNDLFFVKSYIFKEKRLSIDLSNNLLVCRATKM